MVSFATVQGKNEAYGDGATRQAYVKMMNEMVSKDASTIFHLENNFFVKININHTFWQKKSNIIALSTFISHAIKFGAVFPFHFPIRFLEIMSTVKLSKKHMLYFLDVIDKDISTSMRNLKKTDLDTIFELGSDSLKKLIRSKLIPLTDPKLESIYSFMATEINFNTSYGNSSPNCPTIDKILSGAFNITPKMVIKMVLIDNPNDEQLLEKFILTLNEFELKNLLLLFTNSTNVNGKIRITVSEMKVDLDISTCYNTVTLNKNLFESEETLFCLKQYLQDGDQINEKSHFSNYMQQYSGGIGIDFSGLRRVPPINRSGSSNIYPSPDGDGIIYDGRFAESSRTYLMNELLRNSIRSMSMTDAHYQRFGLRLNDRGNTAHRTLPSFRIPDDDISDRYYQIWPSVISREELIYNFIRHCQAYQTYQNQSNSDDNGTIIVNQTRPNVTIAQMIHFFMQYAN